jgi:hypothetical protein
MLDSNVNGNIIFVVLDCYCIAYLNEIFLFYVDIVEILVK